MSYKKVIVIGAGAAGIIAAGRAAELGSQVTLLEKMDRPGNKLIISGNSRCNLSNSRSIDEFIPMYGQNGRFLHRAFKQFFRFDLLQLLASHGVVTAEEAGGRIFPKSGKSSDVVRALTEYACENGVSTVTGAAVLEIEKNKAETFSIHTASASYEGNSVILATGGASYPQTGSTGDGYRLAQLLGHSIVPLRPALAPLVVSGNTNIGKLQGISLPNVRVTLFACDTEHINANLIPSAETGRGIPGKKARAPVIESRVGGVIFTHYGLSGPAILLACLAAADALQRGPVSVSIDLAPDKDIPNLEDEWRDLLGRFGSRQMHTILSAIWPSRLADFLLLTTDIDLHKAANQVAAAERKRMVNVLKNFSFNLEGTRPLREAMVTAGGICLDEVDPQTMESRLVKDLYFCGEILDIDADTGGFNLQAAFSTGYLAGESAARSS
jgi:predicted flavoprotein YhiN